MAKSVTNKTQTIRVNTTLMPEGFGGYLAQNIGSGDVEVDGFILEPGMQLDLTKIPADITWDTPITIICGEGGILRIMRLLYR